MEKEKLVACLKGNGKTLTELSKTFNEAEGQIEKELQEYLDTGVVVNTIKGYMLTTDCNIFLGTIVLRKDNFAYVMPYGASNDKKNDIRVAGKSLDGYIISDKVYFQVDNWNNGTIVGLYKRIPTLSGTVYKAPNGSFRMHAKQVEGTGISVIVKEDLSSQNIVDGDLIKAKIVSSAKDAITVSFDSLLAKANDVGADISAIIASNDAPLTFPSDVLVQAQLIPQSINEDDIKDREDYRNETIVTIDGEDALDFDDAVSCVKINNGYQIGVYIADVSYYVRPNTPLDEEAQKRGTSIYVADRVVPMLPKELSNGICSLNPHVDRLVLAVIMDIDEAGNVYRSSIKPGVINSHGRLTYKEVNELFEGKKCDVITPEISDSLMLMKEVTSKIRLRREKNGALDLDSTEIKFNLDEKGNPIEVIKREQGLGEKMIEDLMIIANVEVAKFLSSNHIPTLYRVHDNPPSEKMDLFVQFLKNIRFSQDFPKTVTSASLAHWYSSITDEKVRFAVSGFLLRSLAKAKYSPDNTGHFGLAEEFYLHFTSPIRRYPDLIVHRTLRDYVFNKERFDEKRLHNKLATLGLLTSECERKADTIERDVDDLEAAKYMSNHIGENFKGVVTGITAKGMYLELDNGIEAFVAIRDIDPSQKWLFNERHMDIQGTIRDENDRLPFYRLGSEFDVVIDSVTMEDRTIHAITKAASDFRKTYASYMDEEEKDKNELYAKPDYKRFSQMNRRSRFSDDDRGYGRSNFSRDREDGPRHSFSDSRRDSRFGDDRGGSRGGYGRGRDDDRGGRSYGRRDYGSDRPSYGDRDGGYANKDNSLFSHRQKDTSDNPAKAADATDTAELTRFVSNTDSQDVQEAKRKFYSSRPTYRNSSSGGRSNYGRSSSSYSHSSDRYSHSSSRGGYGSSRGGFSRGRSDNRGGRGGFSRGRSSGNRRGGDR